MIGKTLLHYEILRLLGRGGMGEVYLARDTKLDRDVALKLLPAELKGDENRRQRFEREARAVAALNHPHVVTLHAVEEADGRPFLVMELVEGDTLDAVIPADGFPLARFLDVALTLTDAVAAAHAKGITHRDLKPQNVMIDPGGVLKILDFGLAKLFEAPTESSDMTMTAAQVTREGVVVGTAAYMSPEQAEGKAVDVRSDVFSLGIILYQMATGRQPFQGETHMSTLTAVMRDEPRPLLDIHPGLPRQLARIIRRCLEKDPDRRYQSARGVHYDLGILREEVVSGEHEAAAPTGPVPTAPDRAPTRASRRRPLWIAAAALALAAAVFAWTQRGGDLSPDPVVATDARPAARTANAEPTIVVFPFENLGPPEDAYFAAGITEEIVTSLTGARGLKVLSRASSQHYDRAGKSLGQIAEDLGVDYVLEGAVRWQKSAGGASRVRVTPQLMAVATDEQVWAEQYDRSMEEIFKVQTEIADEVVRKLGAALTSSAGPGGVDAPTTDMTAYHAYLRAKDILDTARFDMSSWVLAIDLLQKATQHDPDFHLAWVELARANAGLCHFNWDRTEARLAQAKAAADRAMQLAPDSPYSHYAQGLYFYWGLKNYEPALRELRTADRLRPDDPSILECMAYVLRRQDAYEEAVEILKRVAELSPRDAALATHISETEGIIGQYEDAIRRSETAMELGPDQPINFTNGAWIALQAGRPDLARSYIADMPPFDDAEFEYHLFRASFVMREYGDALAHAKALPEVFEAQYETVCRPLCLAMTHRAMGRDALAADSFARAEQAIARVMEAKPEAGNLVAARAIALAGLGRGPEALAEIERSFDLYPANLDLWIRTYRTHDKAHIQILLGRYAEAVETLSALMRTQSDVISPWLLDSAPLYDPLRDRADFRALAADRL